MPKPATQPEDKRKLLDPEEPSAQSDSSYTEDSSSNEEDTLTDHTLPKETRLQLLKRNQRIAKTKHKLTQLQNNELATNKLTKKLTNWFAIDGASGSLAAVAIAALYTGVEKVRDFLPPGIANIIMPFFIIADLVAMISAWKEALINRALTLKNREHLVSENQLDITPWNKSVGDIPRAIKAYFNTWKGARNSLFRAIGEVAWFTAGASVVLGAIITSTFLGAAAAGAFAVVIAPAFMVVLGTRTLFNAVSSAFHFIRAHRTRNQAEKHDAKSDEGIRLNNLASKYQGIAKVQLAAAGASLVGFTATTVVMLLHHFSLAFIGILGGVALGGAMTYILVGNSKWRSEIRKERTGINLEVDRLNTELGNYNATYKTAKDNALIANSLAKNKESGQEEKLALGSADGHDLMPNPDSDPIGSSMAVAPAAPVPFPPTTSVVMALDPASEQAAASKGSLTGSGSSALFAAPSAAPAPADVQETLTLSNTGS